MINKHPALYDAQFVINTVKKSLRGVRRMADDEAIQKIIMDCRAR